ncbi:MAG: hypothetical protein ACM31C_08325, partial [Acidobacteriota bacterium]
MAAIVIALGVVTIAFGERIGINAGQGWDGLAYMRWSDQFWHRVVELGVTRYQAGRVLPSALVYAVMHSLGAAPTVAHHLLAFCVLDVAMLAGAAALWAHLAIAVMRWRAAAAWVGFAALFGGFANARHALYDPVLVDTTAFALGMLLVWGFLARRDVAVAIAGALGVVTWPPLPPLAAVLLVLRRPARPVDPVPRRWPLVAAAVLAVAMTVQVLGETRNFYGSPMGGVGDDKLVEWIRRDLFVLTWPLAALQLAAGWFVVARERRLWNVRGYLRELSWRRVAVALAVIAAVGVARAWWLDTAGTVEGGPDFEQFSNEYALELLRGPAWGLVHHVVYFGPIVLVAVLAWPRVAAAAAEWGPGASLAAAMLVGFSAASESRQWIHLLPLLVALALAATHDVWTPRRALAFGALALA